MKEQVNKEMPAHDVKYQAMIEKSERLRAECKSSFEKLEELKIQMSRVLDYLRNLN